MSRRADAMRHENERIKRESEARLQRKREKVRQCIHAAARTCRTELHRAWRAGRHACGLPPGFTPPEPTTYHCMATVHRPARIIAVKRAGSRIIRRIGPRFTQPTVAWTLGSARLVSTPLPSRSRTVAAATLVLQWVGQANACMPSPSGALGLKSTDTTLGCRPYTVWGPYHASQLSPLGWTGLHISQLLLDSGSAGLNAVHITDTPIGHATARQEGCASSPQP
jgi:hypothetical protein